MIKKLLYTMILSAILMSLFVPQTLATTHVYQDVTAYTGSTTGHGGTLFPNESYSTVAVHQESDSSPIYPFGTLIQTEDPLYLDGYGTRSTFNVTDTGDLLEVRSPNWIDIYFGASTSTNINNAQEFGEQKVTYTVYD